MVKYVTDTSSLIDMWRYYLRSTGLFKSFWDWLLEFFHKGEGAIPKKAFKELEQIEGDFAQLLVEAGAKILDSDDEIRREVDAIAKLLNVQWEEGVRPKGISEADAYIIATAKSIGATVLSEERQPNLPKKGREYRYKMTSVCKLVDVPHINLQKFLIAIAEDRDG